MREPSVGDVLDALHGVGVALLSDPAGRLLGVRQPILHDGEVPNARRGLLLLAGIRSDDGAAAEIIRRAAAGGYGAVALKTYGAPAVLLAEAADSAGIALIGVDDDL